MVVTLISGDSSSLCRVVALAPFIEEGQLLPNQAKVKVVGQRDQPGVDVLGPPKAIAVRRLEHSLPTFLVKEYCTRSSSSNDDGHSAKKQVAALLLPLLKNTRSTLSGPLETRLAPVSGLPIKHLESLMTKNLQSAICSQAEKHSLSVAMFSSDAIMSGPHSR